MMPCLSHTSLLSAALLQLQFIESNITSIYDENQHPPIGFDILFPSLIEYAQNFGINLPIGATSLEVMIQKREIELQR
ncbi:hypothetical protein AAZX31_15G245800 [Glycine max]